MPGPDQVVPFNPVGFLVRVGLNVGRGLLQPGPDAPTDRQRRVLVAAGYHQTAPGGGRDVRTFWVGPDGIKISQTDAAALARRLIRGPIGPATPPTVTPPRVTPIPNGPTVADRLPPGNPYLLSGVFARGPRTRRGKKKRSRLTAAAAAVAVRAEQALQTGEQVFADLLSKARGASRYIQPEFERLMNRAPMSDFERLLHDKPFRAPVASAARVAVSAAARAAGSVALLLWPSSIADATISQAELLRRFPRPQPRLRPPPPTDARPLRFARPGTTPHRLPRPQNQPFPVPASNPVPAPAYSPAPAARPAPAPVAQPQPAPRPAPRTSPGTARTPRLFPFLAPFAASFATPRSIARPGGKRVVLPQRFPSPLTAPKTEPLGSPQGCDCNKATRTRRERKKRCSNPVISRSRKGDTITIVRRIKCPASSRKKRS